MHKSALLHQLQQTYPQNVFTKFIHSFQEVVEVQGSEALEETAVKEPDTPGDNTHNQQVTLGSSLHAKFDSATPT